MRDSQHLEDLGMVQFFQLSVGFSKSSCWAAHRPNTEILEMMAKDALRNVHCSYSACFIPVWGFLLCT